MSGWPGEGKVFLRRLWDVSKVFSCLLLVPYSASAHTIFLRRQGLTLGKVDRALVVSTAAHWWGRRLWLTEAASSPSPVSGIWHWTWCMPSLPAHVNWFSCPHSNPALWYGAGVWSWLKLLRRKSCRRRRWKELWWHQPLLLCAAYACRAWKFSWDSP